MAEMTAFAQMAGRRVCGVALNILTHPAGPGDRRWIVHSCLHRAACVCTLDPQAGKLQGRAASTVCGRSLRIRVRGYRV